MACQAKSTESRESQPPNLSRDPLRLFSCPPPPPPNTQYAAVPLPPSLPPRPLKTPPLGGSHYSLLAQVERGLPRTDMVHNMGVTLTPGEKN